MSLTPPSPPPPAVRPTLAQTLRFWLKLGCVGFGGPTAILAMLHTELVERKRWIGQQRFLHALNFCMTLPGPTAHQLAIYVGWLLHGVFGGVMAGLLFMLPAFVLMVALSWVYMTCGELPVVAGVLHGFKPAVLAIVAFAAVRLARGTLRNWATVALAVVAFGVSVCGVSFPVIIVGAAGIGLLVGWFSPAFFAGAPGPLTKETAAVLGDDEATPRHARISWWRAALVLLIGALLWWGPIHWIGGMLGRYNIWVQMAHFATKAALVGFGGGYAVLAYVAQAAVEQYEWVTATQMMDGLALGETTPGPLIMVLTFVGFVGGWQLGNFSWLGAVFGALYMTYYTFLPSFLFVLFGGPFVEAIRGQLRLTAPLTAISAAVIGVILNMALFFGQRVVLPAAGGVDWFVVGIALAALAALWRFRVGIATTVLACGVIGLVAQIIGLR